MNRTASAAMLVVAVAAGTVAGHATATTHTVKVPTADRRYAQAEAKAAAMSTPLLSCWAEVNSDNPDGTEIVCDDLTQPQVKVPQCQEDEYLQGVGDFTGGRWTAYECAHDNK